MRMRIVKVPRVLANAHERRSRPVREALHTRLLIPRGNHGRSSDQRRKQSLQETMPYVTGFIIIINFFLPKQC